MTKLRKLVSGGVLAALLVSTASPAFARGPYVSGGIGWSSGGWGGGGHGWRGHRRHNRVDAGDVIAGIAIFGAIAAIASSASKSKRDRAEYPREDYPERRDSDRSSSENSSTRNSSPSTGRISTEEAAVDACAIAAEDRAGDAASVRDITSVARTNDGWDVNGVVEDRDNYRDKQGDRRRFSCNVRDGMVDRVTLDDATLAMN